MMRRARTIVRTTAYVSIPAAAIVVLTELGEGALALPSMNVHALQTWVERSDPILVVFALLRGISLLAAWYLLLAIGAGVLVRTLRLHRLTTLLDHITPSTIRSVVNKAVGVSVVGALVIPTSAIAQPSGTTATTYAIAPSEIPTLRHIGSSDVGLSDSGPSDWSSSDTGASHVGSSDSGSSEIGASHVGSSDSGSSEIGASHVGSSEMGSNVTLHTVLPGSSFWSIAEQALQQRHGEVQTHDVVTYWRQLVEHNRNRLVFQSDPDLLRPGQIIELPPPQ